MDYQLFREDFEEMSRMTEENLILFSQYNNVPYEFSKDININKMIEYVLKDGSDLYIQNIILKHFNNSPISLEEKGSLAIELSEISEENKKILRFFIRYYLWFFFLFLYFFSQLVYLVNPTVSYTISLIGVGMFVVMYDDSRAVLFKNKNKAKDKK